LRPWSARCTAGWNGPGAVSSCRPGVTRWCCRRRRSPT
jgi:hypothetical protein